jgi:thioredoxin reductase
MKRITAEEGGYDHNELESLREQFEESKGSSTGAEFVEVDPILIKVSNEVAVEQKEYEARSVIITYDQYGEVVSVELL